MADGERAEAAERVVITAKESRLLALNGLFVLAAIYTLNFAAPVVLPIVLAMLVAILFGPVVDALERLGLPAYIGAAAVVCLAFVVVFLVLIALLRPAEQWLSDLPRNIAVFEQRISQLQQPLREIQEAGEALEDVAQMVDGSDPTAATVEVQERTWPTEILSGLAQPLAGFGAFVVLLFLILASGDQFLRKLVSVIPKFADKRRAIDIVHSVRSDISFYLIGTSSVNCLLGGVVFATASLLSIENAVLWGVATTMLSFALFTGAAANTLILLFVGVTASENLAVALVLPAVFITSYVALVNGLLPYLIGARLLLNPVAMFLSIIFWGWLWGLPGALIAVPLLACFKIVCERIDPLAPLAEFVTR